MPDAASTSPMILLQDVHLKLEGPAGAVNIPRGIGLALAGTWRVAGQRAAPLRRNE